MSKYPYSAPQRKLIKRYANTLSGSQRSEMLSLASENGKHYTFDEAEIRRLVNDYRLALSASYNAAPLELLFLIQAMNLEERRSLFKERAPSFNYTFHSEFEHVQV